MLELDARGSAAKEIAISPHQSSEKIISTIFVIAQ
jgi:hypothetical protein